MAGCLGFCRIDLIRKKNSHLREDKFEGENATKDYNFLVKAVDD